MNDIYKIEQSVDLRDYITTREKGYIYSPERPAPRIFEEPKVELRVDWDTFKEN